MRVPLERSLRAPNRFRADSGNCNCSTEIEPSRLPCQRGKEPRRRLATNSHDFRHWHTTWQLISVFDIPANLPLSWRNSPKKNSEESLEENVWWVPDRKPRGPDPESSSVFAVKRTFRSCRSSRESRDGALENSSGTVKWYNIEIYFYADDDDHHLMGEPVAVAMALLLAMPMPWLPPAPAPGCKLPSCRERCRVPMPIGQMSKQRKFIIKQWQQPESSEILNFKYDGNLSKGVDGNSDMFGQTVLGKKLLRVVKFLIKFFRLHCRIYSFKKNTSKQQPCQFNVYNYLFKRVLCVPQPAQWKQTLPIEGAVVAVSAGTACYLSLLGQEVEVDEEIQV